MSDDIPREQLETALRFLEWSHGDALRRPWSDEAHAYYQAIRVVEDAVEENLLPPDEADTLSAEEELIQRSREARDEGYAEATLLSERYSSSDYERMGFFEWLKSFFVSPNQRRDEDDR